VTGTGVVIVTYQPAQNQK
jgi:hypothetical protein